VEALTEPGDHAMLEHQTTEVLWLDLTFEQQNERSTLEVLWGDPIVLDDDRAGQHGTVVELLTVPDTTGFQSTSSVEMLVSYQAGVASVPDISGPPLVPIQFDGSGSLGFVTYYRWNWISIPGGSAIGNSSQPFPNSGGTTPFDMTNNEVLYHAEEAAGVTGNDTSGNSNNATLTDITLPANGLVGSRAWGYGLATSKALPASSVTIGTSWTIAYWFFNLAPNSSWRTGVRGTSNHHIIVENGGDRLGLFQGGFRALDTGFTMPAASYTGWHHLVAVGKAGGDTDFYIDGAFVGSVIGFRPSDNIVSIGNYQLDNQRFADRLDEFAIWSRELTVKEIKDIYYLQVGTFAAVGSVFPWTPDVEGVYTVQLAVEDGVDGSVTVDTADANISSQKLKDPIQGQFLRFWEHLQGGKIRRRGQ
jgi:hypothetical protein